MLTMRQSLSAALAAGSLAVCACGRQESQQNDSADAANAAQQQAGPTLPLPVPEAPLTREDLLVAALRAATNFAAGANDSDLQKGLADKKFEFRIRFGCDGPAAAGQEMPFGWSYSAKTGALKVRATPGLSPKDPAVKAIAGEAFEAVEGFWVRRPWMFAAACPKQDEASVKVQDAAAADTMKGKDTSGKAADAAGQATPAAGGPDITSRLVGIAQFFTASGPRTMRRSGRPYEATKKLPANQAPSGGFDLVLTGRLVALPNGHVIACTHSGSGEQPSCVISVEFGKVSIERADTHEQLAQWGSG
jgi:hypothetical protein